MARTLSMYPPSRTLTKAATQNLASQAKFRGEGGQNQTDTAISGSDEFYRSLSAQNKHRRNGELLVSEMTENTYASRACLPSENEHSTKSTPVESWRKPLIDQIFITDVTSNYVTVTVKECLTDKGFFRQR